VLDLDSLTPGIQKTVVWLRQHGFETTDSGDGVTNVAAGMEEALDYPHVMISVLPESLVEKTSLLLRLIEARGIRVNPMGSDPQEPAIQATFDPANKDYPAVIMLSGVDDHKLFPQASQP
jgi:hypothetical protein